MADGKWKDVFTACNRGKNTVCNSCGERGATIGCNDEDCECYFHYSCAEDTGWRFEEDGKVSKAVLSINTSPHALNLGVPMWYTSNNREFRMQPYFNELFFG